jgi:tetratricopeptide (TPR) repeat protein
VARTTFNAYGSLIRLGRLGEAHALLLECQQIYSQEKDLRHLGMVFSARADLEDELGHQAEAIELEERALRYSYLAGDVAGIAVSHFNLALYLGSAHRRQDALPHRLAAALIDFQTESGQLPSTLAALGRALAETAAPTSFVDVCAAVKQVEGVRFRELFAALPQRAASADDALAQVLELATQVPNPGPDIEGHLARWQPIIDAVVAASQGDQAAAERLAPDLDKLAESEDWAALVAAIRRILDSERDEDALAAGLDEIDRASLHRILVAVTDSAGGGAIDG